MSGPGHDGKLGRVIWIFAAAALLLSSCTGLELAANTAKRLKPGEKGPGVYKVGKPYQIAGNWYYPKVDYNYDKSGVASWYGPNFDKKPTANGEIFDMRKVSAAHKTLPLPSVVRVTNLENGRSLVIRVNDRGPFARGRIIDLSKRAAELLGFADKGTAMVRVQVQPGASQRVALAVGAADLPDFGPPPPKAAPNVEVTVERLEGEASGPPASQARQPGQQPAPGNVMVASIDPSDGTPPPFGGMSGATGGVSDLPPVPPTPPAASPQPTPAAAVKKEPLRKVPPENEVGRLTQVSIARRPQIFIQAGAFARFDNANRLRARLSTMGPQVRITQVYVTHQPMFRVRIGPLASVAEADITLERMVRYGYPEAQIVID